MFSTFRKRVRDYFDEVVVEYDFDETTGFETKEMTRRDLLYGQFAFFVIFGGALLAFVLLVALLVALSFWPFLLAGVWFYVHAALQHTAVRILAFVLLVGLGWLLYLLRENERVIYACGEICVGVATCWTGVSTATDSGLTSALTMAAGVYVIVRGLDNYAQGKKIGLFASLGPAEVRSRKAQ